LNIFVNGKSTNIKDGSSIADLLTHMEIIGQRIAVEVNEAIVPKSNHDQHFLCEADKVEIVNAIGGG